MTGQGKRGKGGTGRERDKDTEGERERERERGLKTEGQEIGGGVKTHTETGRERGGL